jgi:HPt (histidine-containing phosphotransfer) domain-containing protein
LLSSIVHAFIGRSNDRLVDLRAAVDGGHLADLQAAAHEMKGASGTIGAGRVAALCRELELFARPDAPALRAGVLVELEAELAAAAAELTHYMAAHS